MIQVTDEELRRAIQKNVDAGLMEWVDETSARLTPKGYEWVKNNSPAQPH